MWKKRWEALVTASDTRGWGEWGRWEERMREERDVGVLRAERTYYLRVMEWCRNDWNEFLYSPLSDTGRGLMATADKKWCCCGGEMLLEQPPPEGRVAGEEEESEEEDDGFCHSGMLVTIPCGHVFGLKCIATGLRRKMRMNVPNAGRSPRLCASCSAYRRSFKGIIADVTVTGLIGRCSWDFIWTNLYCAEFLVYVVIMWTLHWLCALDIQSKILWWSVIVGLLPYAIVTTVPMRVFRLGSFVFMPWAGYVVEFLVRVWWFEDENFNLRVAVALGLVELGFAMLGLTKFGEG